MRNEKLIEIVDLHKAFRNQPVLQGVNLTIHRGETTVIIGRSGCGKSVLLKHLIGLVQPDRGHIYVDGDEITSLSRKRLYALRQKFGMLFQASALFDSLTVAENVALGLREHTRLSDSEIEEIVREKLRLVGLADVEQLKPAELSGGMRKRVALARAIALDPEIILYDEPTTGLDPIMADVINELVIALRNQLKITALAVTHDIVSAYKIADRVAMLYDGVIIHDGTPEETRQSTNPVVQQFIHGQAEGPIQAV